MEIIYFKGISLDERLTDMTNRILDVDKKYNV